MTQPATPVDAATVILVRQPDPGVAWECLMVRRHVRSDFAADVYVFPGGKVDPEDCWQGPGVPPNTGDGRSLLDLPFRVAAIRELFEEAGILLATLADGELLTAPIIKRLPEYRRRLRAGQITAPELAGAEALAFDLSRLHPFSRWITPEDFPRRYDTRFFVAFAADEQEPLHDAEETVDSVWVTPRAALDAYAAGRFPLVFATEWHLRRLAQFETPAEVVRSVRPEDLEPVTPRRVQRGDETVFLLPGDGDY